MQKKYLHIVLHIFIPSLPPSTRTSHPYHHHISTGRHPIIPTLTFHMPKSPLSSGIFTPWPNRPWPPLAKKNFFYIVNKFKNLVWLPCVSTSGQRTFGPPFWNPKYATASIYPASPPRRRTVHPKDCVLIISNTPHIHLTIIRSVLSKLRGFTFFIAQVSVPYVNALWTQAL